MKNIRRFVLNRLEDETGISGSGVVAEGVVFSDGVVAVRWVVPENSPPERHHPTSVVFHDEGLASVEKIHGHGGKTRIEFLDDEDEPAEAIVPRVIKAPAAFLEMFQRGWLPHQVGGPNGSWWWGRPRRDGFELWVSGLVPSMAEVQPMTEQEVVLWREATQP